MTTILCRVLVASILGAALIVAGCVTTSPTPKFYTLSSLGSGEPRQQVTSTDGQSIILVGPVRIPHYLDRSQIATRSDKNELELSEFNRWGGSLNEDISRALSENLSFLLADKNLRAIKWSASIPGKAKYQVPVDVMRFEGAPGESVRLSAVWTVMSDSGKSVFVTAGTDIREPVEGADYTALVASMSRALEKMSQEIAESIKTIPQ